MNELAPYFLACIAELQSQKNLAVNTVHLYNVFFGKESIDCVLGTPHLSYHAKGKNCGDWAYLAFTPLDEYNRVKVDFLSNPGLRAESNEMYYMKACFKRNIFVFEKQGYKISYRKDNRPYRQQTHFVKVSVKNGHARLTVRKGALKDGAKRRTFRFNTNYFSFKNLNIIKQATGNFLIQAIFPGCQHSWVQSILQYGENWQVPFKEFRAGISTYKEFIEAHFRNSGSELKITARMQKYPLAVLKELSQINDAFTARVLQEYLAKKDLSEVIQNYTSSSWILYAMYFRDKLKVSASGDTFSMIVDYVSMCKSLSRVPNVRLRSVARLEEEHNLVSRELLKRNMKDFAIEPTPILPKEEQGYFFEQITTKDQLIAEASEMKHCVHSYANQIINNQSIIFSITGKERATLELRILKAGYYPVQLKGKFNANASDNLREIIQRLLEGVMAPECKALAFADDMPF